MGESRKERRERDRAEAKVARRALPIVKDNPVRAPIRQRYAMRLHDGASPAVVLEGAQAEADAFAERVFASSARPACAAGCSHCCESLHVGLSATEADVLANHLLRLPAADLASIRERVAANAARARGTSSTTYPRMTCALLGDDKRCTVYAIRPFVCRRAHSFDADRCRRATEGEAVSITVDARVMGMLSEISTAFREASAAFGGDAEGYELHQALDILLADGKGDLSPARARTDERGAQAIRAAEAAANTALRGKG
jgi:Fe-S-cluster containining protein